MAVDLEALDEAHHVRFGRRRLREAPQGSGLARCRGASSAAFLPFEGPTALALLAPGFKPRPDLGSDSGPDSKAGSNFRTQPFSTALHLIEPSPSRGMVVTRKGLSMVV